MQVLDSSFQKISDLIPLLNQLTFLPGVLLLEEVPIRSGFCFSDLEMLRRCESSVYLIVQAFQRWRLYTKQSRHLADDVPKAELERALRRSKAQVSMCPHQARHSLANTAFHMELVLWLSQAYRCTQAVTSWGQLLQRFGLLTVCWAAVDEPAYPEAGQPDRHRC